MIDLVKKIGVIIILIFVVSCETKKNVQDNSYAADPKSISIRDRFDFFELKDTLQNFELLEYIEGCVCGVFFCVSNSIGVYNNDTLRILSPCKSYNLVVGETYQVIPATEPSTEYEIPFSWHTTKDGRLKLSEFQEKEKKTTFGYFEEIYAK